MPTPSRNWRETPQRYRFEAGRCKNCGFVAFPPRVICPRCRGREFDTVVLPDQGKLLTYTVIRVPPQPFADQAPYAVGIVELENGVRVTAQIVDIEFDRLQVGLQVKTEFRRVSDDGPAGVIAYGYKFVPA
ncbi:MAG: Zn-ribbon domain-containing OB-fold protein [Candidatus Aminicenantes bacterium]|nr:Zn-ribbon domain-containing OB-fold protein [Candidatus Aminicenantes bacterium]